MTVIRPLLVVLMLGAAIPAQAGWFSSNDKTAQKPDAMPAATQAAGQAGAKLPPSNLDDSIREAQMLRLAGQYPEAVKHLSQLMLLASDDPRVVSEYGKTLASMGRASDAINFLTRAQQLQPGDWTIYSALGVAYDQIGDQANAKDNYEHALSIKPEEASVLSNFALSRMLAKDPDMARKLAAHAETAGGMGDPKILRNIAMIRALAPEAPVAAPVATTVAVAPQPAPVSVQPSKPVTAARIAEPHDNRVVMQRVPVDPQAGPVAKPAAVNAALNDATHAPRALLPQVAADASHPETGPAQPAPKPITFQQLPPVASVKADLKPLPAKVAESAKPVASAPARLVPPGPAMPAETATASVSLRLTPPVQGESDKPGQAPKVLPPSKTAAKGVPGLRVSANAY
jgi:Flp pilus assembly protein TadD